MRKLYAVAAAAAFFSTSASAFIIDDFNAAQNITDSTLTPPTQLTDSTVNPGAGGGTSAFSSRFFQISNQSNPDSQTFGLSAGTGVLSVSKGPNSLGKYWAEWTGGTVDFTAGGLDSVKFTILENNGPSPVAEFQFVISDGANTGTFDFSPPFVASGFPQDHTFAYTDFTNSGAIDFTAITQFEFHVDSSSIGNGVDLQLAFFETVDTTPPVSVPVPGTLLLMGGALIGMRRFGKKKS